KRGGTGFVGRALTQLLRSRGHEVTHVSRQGGEGRISWYTYSRFPSLLGSWVLRGS
uniref:NAD-dependent epimerase/dehydratase domain-containing protein n=1 Tax=Athene cunicularia TaxID=194338 RepID=A0A663MYP0_ATHCN